jgi:hypothetical protein
MVCDGVRRCATVCDGVRRCATVCGRSLWSPLTRRSGYQIAMTGSIIANKGEPTIVRCIQASTGGILAADTRRRLHQDLRHRSRLEWEPHPRRERARCVGRAPVARPRAWHAEYALVSELELDSSSLPSIGPLSGRPSKGSFIVLQRNPAEPAALPIGSAAKSRSSPSGSPSSAGCAASPSAGSGRPGSSPSSSRATGSVRSSS